jgi:hypothetical protein
MFLHGRVLVGDAATSLFPPINLQGRAVFDQLVQLYADAGDSPIVTIEADNATVNTIDGGSLTLTGYLLDCTATPCAPIAK